MNGFKYRSNNTVNKGCLNGIETFRDEESLFNDEIYASDFKHLNDPFEATYIDSMDDVFALMNRLGFDKNASLQETWHNIQAFRDKLGVFSLSLSKKCYPDNELLWAHYANSHKGFCIEYDIDKLQDSEQFVFNVNRVESIKYCKTPPTITVADLYSDKLLIKLFGSKSLAWQYENETRLIYSTFGLKKYNPFALKAIYFGLNMSEDRQTHIIDGLKNRDVMFYKMERNPGSYELSYRLYAENKRNLIYQLDESIYEIISTRHNHSVENFHVYYKGNDLNKDSLLAFCNGFRERHCTKQANVYLYDINCDKLRVLIDKYPLRGEDETYMTEHNIAASIFGCEDSIWLYPMK